jgi:CheY-like chemotaxis protein
VALIEGLQKLRHEHVDVLILDLHLQRLDGIGVLEASTTLQWPSSVGLRLFQGSHHA